MPRKSENPSKAALHMRAWRERKKLGLPSRPVGRPFSATPSPAALAKRESRARKAAQKTLAESLAAQSRAAGTRDSKTRNGRQRVSVSQQAA